MTRSNVYAMLTAAALIAFGKFGYGLWQNEQAMTDAAEKAAARIVQRCNPADVSRKPMHYVFTSFFGKEYDHYVTVSVVDRKPDGNGVSVFTMRAVDSYEGGTWTFKKAAICPPPAPR